MTETLDLETRSSEDLSLADLGEGMPGLTPACGTMMAEAASVCLEEQGHGTVVDLRVQGDFQESFDLWRIPVDDRIRRSHEDEHRATENGACGVSILAVRRLTGLSVLRQSRRGTGFDYWLGPGGGRLFQDAARLEVSGIRRGSPRSVRGRLRDKLQQIRRPGATLPALVSVVEFGRAQVWLMKR